MQVFNSLRLHRLIRRCQKKVVSCSCSKEKWKWDNVQYTWSCFVRTQASNPRDKTLTCKIYFQENLHDTEKIN